MPKSRIVFPGDVDVDSGKMPEDGGFRTDSPTVPQVAFHLLCSEAAQRGWNLGSFGVKTAFLSGEAQSREICADLRRMVCQEVQKVHSFSLSKASSV